MILTILLLNALNKTADTCKKCGDIMCYAIVWIIIILIILTNTIKEQN